jgi:hypothetical protein
MCDKRCLWCVVAALPILMIIGCASGGSKAGPTPQREGFVRSLPDTQEPARLLSKDDTVGMRSGLVVLQPGKDCGCACGGQQRDHEDFACRFDGPVWEGHKPLGA